MVQKFFSSWIWLLFFWGGGVHHIWRRNPGHLSEPSIHGKRIVDILVTKLHLNLRVPNDLFPQSETRGQYSTNGNHPKNIFQSSSDKTWLIIPRTVETQTAVTQWDVQKSCAQLKALETTSAFKKNMFSVEKTIAVVNDHLYYGISNVLVLWIWLHLPETFVIVRLMIFSRPINNLLNNPLEPYLAMYEDVDWGHNIQYGFLLENLWW